MIFLTSRSTSCSLGAPYLILFAQSRFLNFDVIAKARPADGMELREEVHPSGEANVKPSSPLRRTADAVPLAYARFHGTSSMVNCLGQTRDYRFSSLIFNIFGHTSSLELFDQSENKYQILLFYFNALIRT